MRWRRDRNDNSGEDLQMELVVGDGSQQGFDKVVVAYLSALLNAHLSEYSINYKNNANVQSLSYMPIKVNGTFFNIFSTESLP